VIVGENTIEQAVDKAALKAEKQVAKELDVKPKDMTRLSRKQPAQSADLPVLAKEGDGTSFDLTDRAPLPGQAVIAAGEPVHSQPGTLPPPAPRRPSGAP
jgi:hypothetical protein